MYKAATVLRVSEPCERPASAWSQPIELKTLLLHVLPTVRTHGHLLVSTVPSFGFSIFHARHDLPSQASACACSAQSLGGKDS